MVRYISHTESAAWRSVATCASSFEFAGRQKGKIWRTLVQGLGGITFRIRFGCPGLTRGAGPRRSMQKYDADMSAVHVTFAQLPRHAIGAEFTPGFPDSAHLIRFHSCACP